MYTLLEFPHSSWQQTEEQQKNTKKFSVGGLNITPLEPMKKWRIEFDGKLKSVKNDNELIDVKIDGIWTFKHEPFNYTTDISANAMSEAIANEDWSRQYFDNLKSYENILIY